MRQEGENQATAGRPAPQPVRRPPALLWQLFLTNAAVITAVFVVLAATPLAITSPLEVWQGGVLSLISLAAVLGVNLYLMRRAVTPLSRLTAFMAKVRLIDDDRRVPGYGNTAEVLALTDAFNAMIDRLQAERLQSSRRILAAQENERLRVARDLHDEVGQRLTALMLELELNVRQACAADADRFAHAREEARTTLEEVRAIARHLRPEALDVLGLSRAVSGLCERLRTNAGLPVECSIDSELPQLDGDEELAIYRIAQESLTNIVRHTDANHAELELRSDGRAVRLRVADDGRGPATLEDGTGVTGMRERAALIGADLDFRRAAIGGLEVALELVPQSMRSSMLGA